MPWEYWGGERGQMGVGGWQHLQVTLSNGYTSTQRQTVGSREVVAPLSGISSKGRGPKDCFMAVGPLHLK